MSWSPGFSERPLELEPEENVFVMIGTEMQTFPTVKDCLTIHSLPELLGWGICLLHVARLPSLEILVVKKSDVLVRSRLPKMIVGLGVGGMGGRHPVFCSSTVC